MKRASSLSIRRGGILQLSTWLILAGSTVSLTSCDSSERKARQARAEYETESKRLINELDSQRQQLLSGEVPNNFHIPGVGYYHAEARDFYETAYNTSKDGKWFVNNAWIDHEGSAEIAPTRPSPEALRRIDETLSKQEQMLDATAAQANQYQQNASSGPGIGSALMMYWLLSGNRGSFMPGAGFSRFGQRAPMFETTYRQQRDQQARSSTAFGAGGSSSGSRTTSRPNGSSFGSSSPGHDSGSSSANRPSTPSAGKSSAPSARGGFGSSGGGSSSS